MSKVVIRKRFDEIKHDGLVCPVEEDRTQQHFKDECDINYLLRHYNDIPAPAPIYADCTQYSNLQDCIDKVRAAQDDFSSVPSDIRARFANNPVDFFNFCNNPANFDELVNLGLAERRTSSLDVTGPTDNKTKVVSSSPTPSPSGEE